MYHLIQSSLRVRSRISLVETAVRAASDPMISALFRQQQAAALGGGDAPRARVPLIKFIGKRSKSAHQSEPSSGDWSVAHTKSRVSTSTQGMVAMSEDIYALKDGAWHGRPRLSPSEIEAIISGGATSL
jgi:hypothetical protein